MVMIKVSGQDAQELRADFECQLEDLINQGIVEEYEL